MFTYYYVLNDYGMPFMTLFLLNGQIGYYPLPTDEYSPYEPNYGNSNFGNESMLGQMSWGYGYDAQTDIRVFFTFNKRTDWSKCRWDPNDNSVPKFWRWSPLSGSQLCYSSEALMYA